MKHPVGVFDLDGTLSDPLDGFARSLNHALRRNGLPEHELATLARFIGPPLDETMIELSDGGSAIVLMSEKAVNARAWSTVGG